MIRRFVMCPAATSEAAAFWTAAASPDSSA